MSSAVEDDESSAETMSPIAAGPADAAAGSAASPSTSKPPADEMDLKALGTPTNEATEPAVAPEVDMTEYRTYAMRWFALLALATLGTAQTLAWNTFAPVSATAAAYYETSVANVNWFGTTIYLSLVITGLFSAYVIDTRGLRVALICSAVLTGTGCWLRYFGSFSSNKSAAYAIAMVGQVMVGVGRPFATSCTTRMAQTWFGVQERTFANLLATVSPSFGIIVSSAATSYIITEPSKVPLALLLWACWSVVPLVLVWFIPEKPPTPPSPSAAVMASNRTNSMEKWKKSFKTAFTNIDYITLWLLMSGQLSIFFIALVLVSSIMLPFGYTSNQIGWVFVVIIASGWTSLPISKIVDKYGTWVLALRLLLVFCTVGLLGLSLTLQLTSDNNWYWAIMLSAAVYGYAQFPTLSIVFELAMECTFPDLLPAMSSYFISALAQLLGVILIPTLSSVQNKTVVLWVLTGISGVTVLLALSFRGKTRRNLHDTTVLDSQKLAALAAKAAVENPLDDGVEDDPGKLT